MNRSRVIWITGLSGSGKTTIANELVSRLKRSNINVIQLDGDVLRDVFGALELHSRKDRLDLAHSYARLCHQLSMQNYCVVCSTISMFHEIHDWNRKNQPRYMEVYLKVPIEVLEKRDSKGIYKKFRQGKISNVAGIDLEVDEPENPDILIENYGKIDVDYTVDKIMNKLTLPKASFI